MDWEWLSCCLASCRGAELRHWASVLPNATVPRVSEETARCMFCRVKGYGEMSDEVGQDKQGKGQAVIHCVLSERQIQYACFDRKSVFLLHIYCAFQY